MSQYPSRVFSTPAPSGGDLIVTTRHDPNPKQPVQPLPPPTGAAPIISAWGTCCHQDQLQAIEQAGRPSFHIVGDTSGVKRPEVQQIVSDHMASDFSLTDAAARPAFFYHLGNVVYFYGETEHYYDQFYEPYQMYAAPIFAIPGNHDGDTDPTGKTKSLTSSPGLVATGACIRW